MKLLLFFTRSVSLSIWYKSGLLDREIKIYNEYLNKKIYSEIFFLTYDYNDFFLRKKLIKEKVLDNRIKIIVPRKFYCKNKYTLFLFFLIAPFLYSKIIKRVDVIKTNQVDGALPALFSKFIYKKKLIFRVGYLPSKNCIELFNFFKKNSFILFFKFIVFRLLEKLIYKLSDITIVTSSVCKNYLARDSNKIFVVPNYIDTSIFKNYNNIKRKKNKILYVGRLTHEKNILNLVKAVKNTNFSLDIYGDGELLDTLKKKFDTTNIKFFGVIPNDKLPHIYNRYLYYIIPSIIEGNPKTLLEAMSCGCICLGTDVDGVNEIISHNITGILIKDTSVTEIYKAINHLNDISDPQKISRESVNLIKSNYSLKNILEKDINIHNIVINDKFN